MPKYLNNLFEYNFCKISLLIIPYKINAHHQKCHYRSYNNRNYNSKIFIEYLSFHIIHIMIHIPTAHNQKCTNHPKYIYRKTSIKYYIDWRI